MAVLALPIVIIFAMAAYSSASYCVCNSGVSDSVLQKNIDYACGAGADCGQISQNGSCYNPNTVKDHCSFAVNSYYQKKGQTPINCGFSGTTTVVAAAPSGVSSACFSGSASGGSSTPTNPTIAPPGSTGTGTGTGTGMGSSTGTGTGTGINTNPSFGGLAPSGSTGINDSSNAHQMTTGFMLLTVLVPAFIWSMLI